MPAPGPEPSVRVGRGRGWTMFAVIAGAVVVAIVVLLWWQDHAAKTARRDRLRAARHAVADAVTAYASCVGGDRMIETWAARPDYTALANECDQAYAEAVQDAADRVAYQDEQTIRDLGWMSTDYYERDAAMPAKVCDHLRELAAGLGRDAPSLACDARVPPFTDEALTDTQLELLLGDDVEYPWTEIVGGKFTAGGSFEDGGVVHTVAVAERDGPWLDAELTGKVRYRIRWATPDTAWAVQDGRVLELDDGAWKPLASVPGVDFPRAMRVVDGGRVLVEDTRRGLVVVRLDASGATETGRVALGGDAADQVWITGHGDVVVENDATLVALPAGAMTPTRTTRSEPGDAEACDDGADVFLVLGTRLLHSSDGGATFAQLAALSSPKQLAITCGSGWLAAVDVRAASAGEPSYFVCRGAGCTEPVSITQRKLDVVELARHGDGLRLYGEQDYQAGFLYEDAAAQGALRFAGAWDVSDPVPFRKVDGTWFQTRGWP